METEDHGKAQAAAQYAAIVEMVAALKVDYDRLEELQDAIEYLEAQQTELKGEWDGMSELDAPAEFLEWEAENGGSLDELREELAELENAANAVVTRCISEDEARELIRDGALEVCVRSDWVSPGEEMQPTEFFILLATGGPAVRIRGELDQYGQPSRAWLEYQDRGTPWTQFYGASQDTLLAYAGCFYFGD